jgi:RimJ/RimL family protein N-acetyltransferase
MVIPRLRTERLLLREWRADDIDDHAAIAGDPEVMELLGGVLDREGAWRQMALHAGHWGLRGYGNWALELNGRMIGRTGLWFPEGWPGLEVGWALARDAWGRGYATEAARAAMEWAWTELGVPRLISVIRPENVRSVRVAERLGFAPDGEAIVMGVPCVIYAITAPAPAGSPAAP